MAETETLETELAAEAQRIEEDTLYSAKGHFEAARSWFRWNLAIGLPTTVAAAVASGAAFADHTITSGILAALVAGLSAVLTFLDPRGRNEQHVTAGNAYRALSNDARIYRRITLRGGDPIETLRTRLEELNERRNALNGSSPQIPRVAYERARTSIEAGESAYAADTQGKQLT